MSKTEPTQSPAIARRPWYRLHFSTWLVAGLGLIVGVLLILPGEEGWYPWEGSLRQERAVIHGWPWLYLWRTPQPWWDDPSVASTFAWDIRRAVKQFQLLPLFADVAICGLGLASIVAMWEWRRRRSRRLQFSVRSLLLVVTLLCIALGWWEAQRTADQDFLRHRAAEPGLWPFVPPVPRFPLWVRIAVGDQQLWPLGLNELPDGMRIPWSREGHENEKFLITRFPKLIVDLMGRDGDGHELDLSQFFEIAATENVVLNEVSDRVFDRLHDLRNLKSISASELDAHALISLGGVASLRNAELVHYSWAAHSSAIDAAAWDQFAESSNIEVLALRHMQLTDLSLAHIARMTRLRELGIVASPITDNGLGFLDGNRHIKELRLAETLITDTGLAYMKSMLMLKWLDLSNTAVTDVGVSALQVARPDLAIRYDSEAPDLKDLKAKIDELKAGKTTRFVVAGWKIQDRHLSELAKLDRIESLAFNAHHVTDATLARVESLNGLKELDVSSSLITGRGLKHLVKLPKLRTLTLDDRQIDDEAINALKQLPALKELWVKCDVGDADLKRLEARVNAAFANDPTVKRHFDRQSDPHSPWD